MSTTWADSANESLVYFDAGDHTLFGILTEPTVAPNGWGLVIPPGGSYAATPGSNRLSFRMARRYAALGFHVLRIDFRGVGESSGEVVYDLSDPFPGDVTAAVRWMQSACPVERFLLAGYCVGGCAALAGAAQIPSVSGVALLASPMRQVPTAQEMIGRLGKKLAGRALRRDAWRGLLDPEKQRIYAQMLQQRVRRIARGLKTRRPRGTPKNDIANVRFVRDMELVLGRKGRVLMLYGTDDHEFDDLRRACTESLGELLADAGALVQLEVAQGAAHGPSMVMQDAIIDRTEAWLLEMAGAETPPAADRGTWSPATIRHASSTSARPSLHFASSGTANPS